MTNTVNRANSAPKLAITVIILTKNESANIAQTIQSVAAFDEVIVVDSGSTDSTADIAQQLGARVVQFDWNGRHPKKKQWSLDNSRARNSWILLLDADERPTPALVNELRRLASREFTATAAFDITLSYKFAGRTLRHGHRVVKRSLLHTERAAFPEVDDLDAPGIREVEGHYQPSASGPVRSLKSRILHDDRDPVSTWFDRHNRYSDWEAHLNQRNAAKKQIARFRTKRGQLFDRAPFKPLTFFLYSYVARFGFLDGRPGFDYAFALTHYYWQIGIKTRELAHTQNKRSK